MLGAGWRVGGAWQSNEVQTARTSADPFHCASSLSLPFGLLTNLTSAERAARKRAPVHMPADLVDCQTGCSRQTTNRRTTNQIWSEAAGVDLIIVAAHLGIDRVGGRTIEALEPIKCWLNRFVLKHISNQQLVC